MVAGPNGSGKSTLIDSLQREFTFPLGFSQNPDEIERELAATRSLDFSQWGLEVSDSEFKAFVGRDARARAGLAEAISVAANRLIVSAGFERGYLPSLLCDFMRGKWVESGQSFTFETVMSHPDKVLFLEDAQKHGYRTYLYYVCTESSLINVDRVASRVSKGGHAVPDKKITERYDRSLKLLSKAVAFTNRAYFFDNSSKQGHRLIAEYEAGRMTRASQELPGWFVNHLL
jgi:predicted ABC-type ATPase